MKGRHPGRRKARVGHVDLLKREIVKTAMNERQKGKHRAADIHWRVIQKRTLENRGGVEENMKTV